MLKYELQENDIAYTTGAYIRWNGKWWDVVSFEDDTYYDGELVEEVESKPYIGENDDDE